MRSHITNLTGFTARLGNLSKRFFNFVDLEDRQPSPGLEIKRFFRASERHADVPGRKLGKTIAVAKLKLEPQRLPVGEIPIEVVASGNHLPELSNRHQATFRSNKGSPFTVTLRSRDSR